MTTASRFFLGMALVATILLGMHTPTFGQTIKNGSFEVLAEGFNRDGNGYILHGPSDDLIDNKDAKNHAGILAWRYNPTGVSRGYGLSSASNPFASGTPIPDGNLVAFIQKDGSLTTTVSDLTIGETYVLSYYYNARTSGGDKTAIISSTIDGAVFQPQTNLNGLNWASYGKASNITGKPLGTEYYYFSQSFIATANEMDLVINSHISGNLDQTLLLDNVTVRQFGTGTGWGMKKLWTGDADSGIISGAKYTHALSFRRSTPGAAFEINDLLFTQIHRLTTNVKAGSYSVSAANDWDGTGISSTMVAGTTEAPLNVGSRTLAGEFIYNVSNITLDGLIPGMFYETTLFTNSFGGQRYAMLTANGDAIDFNAYAFSTTSTGTHGGTITWTGKAAETAGGGQIKIDVSNYDGGNALHIHGVAVRAIPQTVNGLLMATGFSGGLNGANFGGEIVGTTLDYHNAFNQNAVWVHRGEGAPAASVAGYAVLQADSGIGMAFPVDESLICHAVQLSVDVYLESGAKLGVGFFDSTVGGGGDDPVTAGFSGITLANDGTNRTLGFYDDAKTAQTESDLDVSALLTSSAWHNVLVEVWMLGDGMASLESLWIDGIAVDLDGMYGSTFSSTAMLGFAAMGAGGDTRLDNIILNDVGPVPEPATWAMLAMGLLAMGVYRRRRMR